MYTFLTELRASQRTEPPEITPPSHCVYCTGLVEELLAQLLDFSIGSFVGYLALLCIPAMVLGISF